MLIAIALFDGVEELDFAGPWDVLSYWAREIASAEVRVVTVAPSLDAVRAAKGLRVLPDVAWSELPRPDVLVMPGGRGTRALLAPGTPVHATLQELHDAGTLMTSVCTGALVYAAAGLLHGRPVTTYWSSFPELLALDATIIARPDDRWVDDGDVVTAAGVSAGIDMALHLVHRLDSEHAARATRRGIQYDPQPPV